MERSSDQAEACPLCGLPAVEGHSCGGSAETPPAPTTLATTAMGAMVGRFLGQNYRVLEPIGAGAMGVVYVVEHLALRKRFAAKLLTADLARHPEAIARFEVEAHAASQLEHENIVSVTDFGKTDEGGVYIIMELLRGKTLQARMDQGRLSLEETVSIIMQVCRALSAAHGAGIVHRDMKPDNIFLTQRPGGRPRVKVLDFGISKAREGSIREGRITKQGQLLGSPEYMSPEASRGDEVDARADVYAVGVILYELLCGDVPFRHENYLKVLQMHATQPPRPPRELAPELPETVERLILRALEKDPRRRQASIDELEGDLMAALPEVAQRALIQNQTPPHGQWLAASTQGVQFISETSPGMEWTGMMPPRTDDPRDKAATLISARRRRRRQLLLVMWSATAILAAAAVTLVILKPPVVDPALPGHDRASRPAEVFRTDAARVDPVRTEEAASPSGVEGERAADAEGGRSAPFWESRAREVRLRISTTPPGALATLEGVDLGRTPLDVKVAAADRAGSIELDLPGYKLATRSIPLDRDGEIRLSVELERDARRPIPRRGGGKGGKGPAEKSSTKTTDADARPSGDLEIKKGR